MPATPENACVSPVAGARATEKRKPSEPSPPVPSSPEECSKPGCSQLQQAHRQLEERFLRTNNALASAAHDLKTPLAILNGYVELLQSEKLGTLNDRQREVLSDMRSNGQRLQHFIEDFLSFSVLETGPMKLRYEKADMNACLSEVCRLWSPRFHERKLALYFLANDKLTEFSFDVPKVERVVSNLLENASKFTPSGGTVWLHAEPYVWDRRVVNKVVVQNERRQQNRPQNAQTNLRTNAVKVSVSDTGPGIPAEYHIEVFDDFFRLAPDRGTIRGHRTWPGYGATISQHHGRQNLGRK